MRLASAGRSRLWGKNVNMLIQQLQMQSFRRFQEAAIQLQPGFNILTGVNGSGKTSVLEALHLMAHGRSFRGRVRDGLIRQGDAALNVFVQWVNQDGQRHKAGLRHTGNDWQARLDEDDVQQLTQLCAALTVVTFEPGSHALIDGASELRRRYLDWAVFHVEHGFTQQSRRYARALKQRNALLRQPQGYGQLDAWEHELAQSGEAITLYRQASLAALHPWLEQMLVKLLPSAGAIQLQLATGWKQAELSLQDALFLARERDQTLGYTSVGPHRADLRWELANLPGRGSLSRGQTKQFDLVWLLAQAAYLAERLGHWPVVQLDDLGSELDQNHQTRVLDVLSGFGAQVLVTGTHPPQGLSGSEAMFHVEHGVIAACV